MSEYRREKAKLKFHNDFPDLYTMDHSVILFRSWKPLSEYPHKKVIQSEVEDLEETLMRLFGVYHTGLARNGSPTFFKHLDPKK